MKKICIFLLLIITSVTVSGNDADKKTLIKSSKSWNGNTLPSYPKGQPEITIMQITIEPQEKLPWHIHPVISAGILTKGELTIVTKDGQKNYLKANHSIVDVVDTIHYGINEGDKNAEIVVFYAGIKDKPVTIIKD